LSSLSDILFNRFLIWSSTAVNWCSTWWSKVSTVVNSFVKWSNNLFINIISR
jgi:hypothetical protein